jgi:branched-chain amino acid transport system ATP-binding protein
VGLLSVEDVVAGYSAADEILKGVRLDVDAGEIVGVIGPNGSGKSTLLKVIAGVLRPSRGRVTLDDTPIGGRAPQEISALGVAFVPQERNVFPTLSVRENLEMAGYLDPQPARQRIETIFGRFPLLAERRRHAARTLSGGQRQILAMAMALMVEPRLLLLDEPSAGLAPLAAERLFETIRAINADGVAIVMVEQNALEALAIARRGYLLVDGRTVTSGEAAALAGDPDVRRLFLGGISGPPIR